MWLAKDRDLKVLCALFSPAREFIKYHEIFLQEKCTFVHPTAEYLAVQQIITIDWNIRWALIGSCILGVLIFFPFRGVTNNSM